MKTEELIELAKEAGFSYDPKTNMIFAVDGRTEVPCKSGIQRFATLIENRTLERAAEVCELDLYRGEHFASEIRALKTGE